MSRTTDRRFSFYPRNEPGLPVIITKTEKEPGQDLLIVGSLIPVNDYLVYWFPSETIATSFLYLRIKTSNIALLLLLLFQVAVIRAADMFCLDGLKTLCRYLLNKSLLITTENVCDIYSQVSGDTTIGCLDDIRKDCLEFMASNMKSISRSKAFGTLPKEAMLEIVQQVSELNLK